MTEPKPPGVGLGTWVERQLREAAERGAFDNLPGAGKPIADLDQPHDQLWWIRQKLRRENLTSLPPTIALGKQAEDALVAASQANSEGAGAADRGRQQPQDHPGQQERGLRPPAQPGALGRPTRGR
jgi:hypothetical protein